MTTAILHSNQEHDAFSIAIIMDRHYYRSSSLSKVIIFGNGQDIKFCKFGGHLEPENGKQQFQGGGGGRLVFKEFKRRRQQTTRVFVSIYGDNEGSTY